MQGAKTPTPMSKIDINSKHVLPLTVELKCAKLVRKNSPNKWHKGFHFLDPPSLKKTSPFIKHVLLNSLTPRCPNTGTRGALSTSVFLTNPPFHRCGICMLTRRWYEFHGWFMVCTLGESRFALSQWLEFIEFCLIFYGLQEQFVKFIVFVVSPSTPCP